MKIIDKLKEFFNKILRKNNNYYLISGETAKDISEDSNNDKLFYSEDKKICKDPIMNLVEVEETIETKLNDYYVKLKKRPN